METKHYWDELENECCDWCGSELGEEAFSYKYANFCNLNCADGYEANYWQSVFPENTSSRQITHTGKRLGIEPALKPPIVYDSATQLINTNALA